MGVSILCNPIIYQNSNKDCQNRWIPWILFVLSLKIDDGRNCIRNSNMGPVIVKTKSTIVETPTAPNQKRDLP